MWRQPPSAVPPSGKADLNSSRATLNTCKRKHQRFSVEERRQNEAAPRRVWKKDVRMSCCDAISWQGSRAFGRRDMSARRRFAGWPRAGRAFYRVGPERCVSLPERVIAYLHYANEATASSAATQYWRHYELIALGFLITRIIGFSLLAVRLRKGGSEVEELLLPSATEENSARA